MWRFKKVLAPTPALLVYLSGLIVFSSLLLTTSAVTLACTITDEEFLHNTAVEWCSFVSEAVINCSPVSLCFLSIDRILVIRRTGRYNNKEKWILAAVAIFTALAIIVAYCLVGYSMEGPDEKSTDECPDGTCDDKDMAETFPAFDVGVSTAGLLCAAVLFICLRMVMTKSSHMRKNMKVNNRIVLYNMALHVLFDVVPGILHILYHQLYSTELSEVIGPFQPLVTSLNYMLCSLIQLLVFYKTTKSKASISNGRQTAAQTVCGLEAMDNRLFLKSANGPQKIAIDAL